MKKPFTKYFCNTGDNILIKSAVMDLKTPLQRFLKGERPAPYLYKVEVLHHTLRGYAVIDGDGLKYFVPYKYVVAKD